MVAETNRIIRDDKPHRIVPAQPLSRQGRRTLKTDPSRPTLCGPVHPRVRHVCWQFGITPQDQQTQPVQDYSLLPQPGEIILLTGPSGAGKSSTLHALSRNLAGRAVCVDRQRLDPRRPIIEQVAAGRPLAQAISILTACGLGEPRLWLRRPQHLSDGERFRARLARAVGIARSRPGAVLLVDEFCAVLHRRLALAMAFTLRKMVTADQLCLVAATTHDDLIADLQPDCILHLGDQPPRITRRNPAAAPTPRPISFFRRLHIEPGRLRDYQQFEAMHYRRRTGLGPFDKVFVLRDGLGGQALGVVVYAYSPLSLHLRNFAVGQAYHRNGRLINRDFRILRRLVLHPDVRGCGLAHHLVRQTLPQVGTRYVECLAAMGAVNPIFERAGMIRLGTAGQPGRQETLRKQLAALKVDPLADDFEEVIRRRPDVRALVARHVHAWVEATTGRPIQRIRAMDAGQLASAFVQLMGTMPIYYLWSQDETENARLRAMATQHNTG